MSVCPSVRPRGTSRIPLDGFSLNVIFEDFCKICRETSVSLESDKNNRTLHGDQCTSVIISRSFLLRMRNVSDKSCRENQNTRFVFCIFFFENRAVYEIMWKNILQRGRPKMTIWRMRIACWIPKATNTYSEYVIFISFPLQQ